MLFLKILAFVFLGVGFIMVFASRTVVTRFGLDKNAKCEHQDQMSEDEIKQYKYNRAVVNFKMLGMLVALPGLIMVLVLFK